MAKNTLTIALNVQVLLHLQVHCLSHLPGLQARHLIYPVFWQCLVLVNHGHLLLSPLAWFALVIHVMMIPIMYQSVSQAVTVCRKLYSFPGQSLLPSLSVQPSSLSPSSMPSLSSAPPSGPLS